MAVSNSMEKCVLQLFVIDNLVINSNFENDHSAEQTVPVKVRNSMYALTMFGQLDNVVVYDFF